MMARTVMGAWVRYCPECREEYQPHMTECLDCGAALKERLDSEPPEPHVTPELEPADLPPGEYRRVDSGLSASVVEPLVRMFVAAGVPVKVESVGYGLTLSARDEDRAAVVAILEREGVIPAQPDATAAAVAAEGGPCPACGSSLEPGTFECPECGLLVGGGVCESCEAELSPTDEVCPACGHSPNEEAK
jgi:hypothetical protein